MPWTTQTFQLLRLALHARELDAGGPLLVLLHGLSADGSVWQGVGRRLSPPFTLLAPDLRGHGLSDHPADGYRGADYAADIAELLGVLAREHGPVRLLGHSLGAIAALGAAAMNAGTVHRLILVDPPLDGPGILPAYVQRMLAARRLGDDAAVRALIVEQTPGLSDRLVSAYAEIWGRVADAALEAVAEQPSNVFAGVTEWYGHVTAPVLIMRADPRLDSRCSDSATEQATRSLGRSTVVIVEGASHVIHASKPVEFSRLVIEFLHHG